MTKHDLVLDLMDAYRSGEASKETKKQVEEHLAGCDECREVYEQEKTAEKLLSRLKAVEIPINGKKFVVSFRRILYGFGVGILALLTILLASVEYIAFENILGLQVPRLLVIMDSDSTGGIAVMGIIGYITATILQSRGKEPLWLWTFLRVVSLLTIGFMAFVIISAGDVWVSLLIGLLMLGLYLYLLDWREKFDFVSNRIDFFHSLETVIPLFVLGLGMGGAQSLGGIAILSLIMLIALSITLIRLPRLRYMSLTTTLVMLATVGLVAGQTGGVLIDTLDLFPILPSALGNPPTGADPEDMVILNNPELGLNYQSSENVTEVNGIPIVEGAQAVQALYYVDSSSGHNDMVTRITVVEFDTVGAARTFINDWYDRQGQWEYELYYDLNMEETLMFDGRFIRTYDTDVALAHNIWQLMKWVTIIETEGALIDAMSLNKEIRNVIADRYNNDIP